MTSPIIPRRLPARLRRCAHAILERGCGPFWSRARTLFAAMCCNMIWPKVWHWPMKSLWPTYSSRKPFPRAERLNLNALIAEIQQQGKKARICSGRGCDRSNRPRPKCGPGDVVAILSNGGFGGIYEKLPQRLKSLWNASGSHPRGVRQSVNTHSGLSRLRTSFSFQSCSARVAGIAGPARQGPRNLSAEAPSATRVSLAHREKHLVRVTLDFPSGRRGT